MADTIRRKVVSIDGAEFLISNLTLKMTRELAEEESKIKSGDSKAVRNFRLRLVAKSLNRSSGSAIYDELMNQSEGSGTTATSLEDVLDHLSLNNLFFEILGFSGLMVDRGGAEVGATGESKA